MLVGLAILLGQVFVVLLLGLSAPGGAPARAGFSPEWGEGRESSRLSLTPYLSTIDFRRRLRFVGRKKGPRGIPLQTALLREAGSPKSFRVQPRAKVATLSNLAQAYPWDAPRAIHPRLPHSPATLTFLLKYIYEILHEKNQFLVIKTSQGKLLAKIFEGFIYLSKFYLTKKNLVFNAHLMTFTYAPKLITNQHENKKYHYFNFPFISPF